MFPIRRPTFSPSFSITLDTVLGKLLARSGFYTSVKPGDLDALHHQIRQAADVIAVQDLPKFLDQVDNAIRTLFALADIFVRHIKHISPRQIWMANYYSLTGMAMCVAGSRLGIPTVDISHGSSGDLHYAYSGFKGHPAGGYPMVPNYFLSRHEGDAAALEGLVAGSSVHHRPIVVGDLAAHSWREDAFGLASKARRLVDAAIGPSVGEKKKLNVLIAAQAVEHLPERLVEAMKNASGFCQFWIRLHPIYFQSAEVFRIPEGIDHLPVKFTTTMPLFSLLERVDAIITGSSSVAEDGLGWEIPAVVIDKFGQAMFASYIENGLMHSADTAGDIVAALEEIHSEKISSDKKKNNRSVSEIQKHNLIEFIRQA